MPEPTIIRETLLGVLSTFAKVEWQLAHIYSPDELYCQWFDDVYHPDTDAWRDAFSESEQHALAAFTTTLRRHSDYIDGRGLKDVLGTEEWYNIGASANEALTAIMATS